VAIEGLLTERLRSIGVVVHCPGSDFAVPTARSYLAGADVLDRVKPDLVHANALVGPGLLAACVRQHIPFVQWMRRAECAGLDEHLACAERIIAVSKFIACMLSHEMLREGKVRVLYDAVDCEHCAPDRQPRRDLNALYGIRRDDRVILCIARFVPYKRHDVLLEAFSRLARQRADVRLVLIGSKPASGPSTYEGCVSLVNARGLSDRVLLLDFQEDVLDFEQRADVVVLCSEREPLGTVVLESMAFGRPVVVAASGGLPEMTEDRVSGLHCVAGDAESLHAQLLRILGDEQLAQKLGANARETAVQRFSVPVHASELRAVYAEILG
jgi:glycosyltransferase involved in cell wall biosynthesis